MDKIRWEWLSSNPNAMPLLEKNINKVNWLRLSSNPGIFDLDRRFEIYNEELIQRSMHPKRIKKYIELGYDIDEILEFM